MSDFQVHTAATAPAESQPLVEAAQSSYGFLPNLLAVFAESPAVLEAYMSVNKLIQDKTAFTAVEQQTVLLSVSHENECRYCMAAHSTIAGMVQMPEAVLTGLRDGSPLPDAKLEALRTFTQTVVRERGWVPDEALAAFQAAGYDHRHVLEVLLGVALKTMSNFTNHIAETPLDTQFSGQAWEPRPVGTTA